MADPIQYKFELTEVAELLARKAGVKKGLWQLSVQFGLAAANAGPNEEALTPSAIVGVLSIGLSHTEKKTNLTIDASRLIELQKASRKKDKKSRISRPAAAER